MAAAVKSFFREQEFFLNEPSSSMWFQNWACCVLAAVNSRWKQNGKWAKLEHLILQIFLALILKIPVTDQPNHKLYIETVGCQMNVLDSEMVVADLRRRGYELTDNTGGRPTRSSSTPAASGEHAEDKIYSRTRPVAAGQTEEPGKDHRRDGLHGPEGPRADLSAGSLCRPGCRARPTCSKFPT